MSKYMESSFSCLNKKLRQGPLKVHTWSLPSQVVKQLRQRARKRAT